MASPEKSTPAQRPIRIVQTTVGSRQAAQRLADRLIGERLAACVQVWPIRSVYRWHGKVCRESEWLLQAKTRPGRGAALAARLRALHPYETPEIVAFSAAAAPAYQLWVLRETAGPR